MLNRLECFEVVAFRRVDCFMHNISFKIQSKVQVNVFLKY